MKLTKYLPLLKDDIIGEWIIDRENDGSAEHPICLPYVAYSKTVLRFWDEFYLFNKANEEFALSHCATILEENDIDSYGDSLTKAELSRLDARCIMAMMIRIFSSERFSDGVVLYGFKSGHIFNCLERLKEIDEGK